MTDQEVQALAQLLARTPMTLAEAAWVRALLARLAPTKEADEQAAIGNGTHPVSIRDQ